MYGLNFITGDKDMANGMRNISGKLLNEDEIEYVRSEIRAIEADEDKFIFNDPDYQYSSTCYNFSEDKVYVTRNVFPDDKYGSTHPRDIMSVRAVLAHEYYGHRKYLEEYISDDSSGKTTTPLWQDECRASITAAKIAHGLSDRDKCDLVMDAVYRAKEYGQLIEMDDFMKEIVYGYPRKTRNIVPAITPIRFVSEESTERNEADRKDFCEMPKVRRDARHDDDPQR